MIMEPLQNLIGHAVYLRSGQTAARSLSPGAMYNYLLAGNGVHLLAERSEMAVSFPIATVEVRGLPRYEPLFDFRLPHVPVDTMDFILRRAAFFADQQVETLFHLTWSELNPYNDGWLVEEPEQERTATSCRPLESGSSHERAILEIHSHHSMPARFSSQDDADETGFRLYAVIGELPRVPKIRLRVGVYGYFWEIPASWVMELPLYLQGCNAEVGHFVQNRKTQSLA